MSSHERNFTNAEIYMLAITATLDTTTLPVDLRLAPNQVNWGIKQMIFHLR